MTLRPAYGPGSGGLRPRFDPPSVSAECNFAVMQACEHCDKLAEAYKRGRADEKKAQASGKRRKK